MCRYGYDQPASFYQAIMIKNLRDNAFLVVVLLVLIVLFFYITVTDKASAENTDFLLQRIIDLEKRHNDFEARINALIDAAAAQNEIDYDVKENSDDEFKENVTNSFLLLEKEIKVIQTSLKKC